VENGTILGKSSTLALDKLTGGNHQWLARKEPRTEKSIYTALKKKGRSKKKPTKHSFKEHHPHDSRRDKKK